MNPDDKPVEIPLTPGATGEPAGQQGAPVPAAPKADKKDAAEQKSSVGDYTRDLQLEYEKQLDEEKI
jgi:hypothetical protein